MIGTIIEKPVVTQEQLEAYAEIAAWCNDNGARIEDKGGWFEVCAVPEPEAAAFAEEEAEGGRGGALETENAELRARLAVMEERLAALEALLEGDLR